MSVVLREMEIARPPGLVFEALVDPAQRARWSTTFEEQPLAGPMQPGARIHARRRASTSGSRYELSVTALEPGRRLVMRVARNGKHVATGSFELQPVPGGTRVRSTSALELSGMQRLMEPMLAAAAAREMDQELASLKRHVEGRA